MTNKNYTATVIDLANVVKYAEESVVSKTIVNKKAGTCTVFSFDKGEGLSEHTASYDAIIEVLDGEAEITIEKEKFTLKTGEMIIMPANKPHSVQAISKFKMLLIMIKSE